MNKVMIIEDDALTRRGLAKALALAGFDVIEADGGREALRLIEQARPCVVVTDLNMPDVNGIEVILDVTRREPPIPVVAMSGGGMFAKELLLDNARALGAVRTLAKPFELTELVEAVRDAGALPTR